MVSDIIFLQKRDRPLDIVPEWTQTGQTEDGFAINRYFIDHPEMVLGRQEPVSTAHGMDYTDVYKRQVQFKAAATVSITYALMSRCGLEPERYFDHEDFMAIFDFNTPATIGALGTAVSQINQQVLRQIGVTVRNAEREMCIRDRRRYLPPGNVPMAQREEEPSWLNINW